MKLLNFTLPPAEENKEVKTFMPTTITVIGFSVCESEDIDSDLSEEEKSLPITKNDILMLLVPMISDIDERIITVQLLFELTDEFEPILCTQSPLFVLNLAENIQTCFNECITITENQTYGIGNFEFSNSNIVGRPYIMQAMVQGLNESPHVENILLTKDQYLHLNRFINSFRSCIWLNPSVFNKKEFTKVKEEKIMSIIYEGTLVQNGNNATISCFTLYPENRLSQPYRIGMPTGTRNKNRILKHELSIQKFSNDGWSNEAFIELHNTFGVQTPEPKVYMIYRAPGSGKPHLLTLDVDLIKRTHFFDWNQIMYI